MGDENADPGNTVPVCAIVTLGIAHLTLEFGYTFLTVADGGVKV